MFNQKYQHRQVVICPVGDFSFTVDEDLQSLIEFYVENKIHTWNSCQDNNGTCWIEYDLGDWIKIVDLAFRSESQDLYEFIEELCNVNLHVFDNGHYNEEKDCWEKGDLSLWTASVRFPRDMRTNFELLIRAIFSEYASESLPNSSSLDNGNDSLVLGSDFHLVGSDVRH